ncbi:unnamed protein product [Somion occarium]|uniref:Transmembrane protein 242 n=1 Tax=Somion occarium TaxID=3059160 RepID=A0ABP1DP27_9APHY
MSHPGESIKSEKKSVPKWVPISLLALTTAALAVPIVLLRRQRASVLTKTLESSAPPPPRRTALSTSITATSLSTRSAPPPRRVTNEPPSAEDGFNAALYTAKAFGLATLLVTVGATTAIIGVKSSMGVRDTQEFADRMRSAVERYMPMLSSRIHRPPAPEEHGEDAPPLDPPHLIVHEGESEWTWPAAQARLENAFERDGFSGWAEAALKELEAEGAVKRSKRHKSEH